MQCENLNKAREWRCTSLHEWYLANYITVMYSFFIIVTDVMFGENRLVNS